MHPTLLALLNRAPKSRQTGFVLPEFAEMYRNNDTDVAKILRNGIRLGGDASDCE